MSSTSLYVKRIPISLSAFSDRIDEADETFFINVSLTGGAFENGTTYKSIPVTIIDDPAVHGTTGADLMIGTAGADDLRAYEGNDTLRGLAGNDILDGGEGDDKLLGGAGNDTLLGGDGNDVLYGGEGNDSLEGGDGDDSLLGGNGNDILFGGNGDDYLNGGAGDDILIGDAGADVFVFTGGRDRIADFEDNIDTIQISARLAGPGATVQSILDGAFLNGNVAVLDFGAAGRLAIAGVTDLAQLHDDLVLI